MLEIIAFIVTFGGMLLYGFGHAFAYANQNRVIRKTVENVVDEKLHTRKGSKLIEAMQKSNSSEAVTSNTHEESTATIDYDFIKQFIVKSDWDFNKNTVVPGEDHSELYKQLKDQHEASRDFENTVLTADINSQLDQLFNDVSQNNTFTHDVGPNVAKLITSSIENLEINKTNIIVGTVHNGLVDNSLELSDCEEIVCGKDDLMIIKGILLPNNKFRVITTEDADTYESGYSDAFRFQDKEAI